jgi:hypothetical protein
MIDLPTIVWFAATGSPITTEITFKPLSVGHLEFAPAPRLELAYRDAIGHTLRRAHMSKARDNFGFVSYTRLQSSISTLPYKKGNVAAFHS